MTCRAMNTDVLCHVAGFTWTVITESRRHTWCLRRQLSRRSTTVPAPLCNHGNGDRQRQLTT